MKPIIILDVFSTADGPTIVLDCPQGGFPRIGTKLKTASGVTWTVTGVYMPTSSDMTNGYKDLDPPRTLFTCLVKTEVEGQQLKKGDELYQIVV